jgi:hypothetical protein
MKTEVELVVTRFPLPNTGFQYPPRRTPSFAYPKKGDTPERTALQNATVGLYWATTKPEVSHVEILQHHYETNSATGYDELVATDCYITFTRYGEQEFADAKGPWWDSPL